MFVSNLAHICKEKKNFYINFIFCIFSNFLSNSAMKINEFMHILNNTYIKIYFLETIFSLQMAVMGRNI